MTRSTPYIHDATAKLHRCHWFWAPTGSAPAYAPFSFLFKSTLRTSASTTYECVSYRSSLRKVLWGLFWTLLRVFTHLNLRSSTSCSLQSLSRNEEAVEKHSIIAIATFQHVSSGFCIACRPLVSTFHTPVLFCHRMSPSFVADRFAGSQPSGTRCQWMPMVNLTCRTCLNSAVHWFGAIAQ